MSDLGYVPADVEQRIISNVYPDTEATTDDTEPAPDEATTEDADPAPETAPVDSEPTADPEGLMPASAA
ncbi:hypothetical protein ACVBEQ_27760 [Nakamurella sp. GG22]